MDLLPSKLDLIDLEIHRLHIIVRLLLNTEGLTASEFPTADIFETLHIIAARLELLALSCEEYLNEKKY